MVIPFQFAMVTIELRTEQCRGLADGQAGGIQHEPKLITFPNLRIGEKAIERLRSRFRAREESVHKQDGNFIGIVRLELKQTGLVDALASEKE